MNMLSSHLLPRGRIYVRTFSILCVIFTAPLAPRLAAFTRDGTNLLTNGSAADVNAAIQAANRGDTIRLPAGTFTWGDGGGGVYLDRSITLAGAGQDLTIIQVSSTAGTWSNAVIQISAGGTVRDLTVRGAAGSKSAFATWGPSGWRITAVTYLGVNGEGYFCYVGGNYGLIDNCLIVGGGGASELIFTRGPENSWQTPSTIGSVDAVYVEDTIFDGSGYVSDFNSNARGVVRFCTIKGTLKIDAHGLASNTPARGVRHTEVYRNRWTTTYQYFTAIEIRGGSGHVFDNQATAINGAYAWFFLKEYGCNAQWPNFNMIYQTPINYPIRDQVGLGADPRVAGSEPFYIWNNTDVTGGDWPLNKYNNFDAAIALYRVQTGNPSATFGIDDIIKPDRDYFKHTKGEPFNGSSGIGRGTKAQMLAIQASRPGVGYWVTDEGDWDRTNGAQPDGQFYVWNGSSWVLRYTPLNYPHPQRQQGAPSNVRINVRVN